VEPAISTLQPVNQLAVTASISILPRSQLEWFVGALHCIKETLNLFV
jgi:hypothetical protein